MIRRTLQKTGLALATALAVVTAHKAIAADVFVVLNGYGAKETCSCAFVVEQTDDYCKVFGQGSATFQVDLTIDHGAKKVTSNFGNVTRTAHFTDGQGCTLDGL
jgi:hypothetical protein